MFNAILLIAIVVFASMALWHYRTPIVYWFHNKSYSLFKLFIILTAWTLLCLGWFSCSPKFNVRHGDLVMDNNGVLHICPESDTIQIYKKIRVVVNHEYCGHSKKGGDHE